MKVPAELEEGTTAAAEPTTRPWQELGERPTPASDLPASHSRFLHVVEQGAWVRRVGSRVQVLKDDSRLLDVQAVKLQGVLLYGGVQISTQCLKTLLSEGVWVALFTRHGRYRGRLQPPAERGGRARRLQWKVSGDAAQCLAFSRTIVRAKLCAQRTLARQYARNYPGQTLKRAYLTIRELFDAADRAEDAAALRGIEGAASRAYFELFRDWNRSDLPFERRQKRPAEDPINALLNLGYTLLTGEAEGLIEASGLDPTVGFYHLPDGDRPSLACDWVEEFRHPIVDRLVLTLVNRRELTRASFEEAQEGRGLRLTPDGLRAFLQAYERTMTSEAGSGSPRRVMLRQLGLLYDAAIGASPYRACLAAQPCST